MSRSGNYQSRKLGRGILNVRVFVEIGGDVVVALLLAMGHAPLSNRQ